MPGGAPNQGQGTLQYREEPKSGPPRCVEHLRRALTEEVPAPMPEQNPKAHMAAFLTGGPEALKGQSK